MFNMMKNASRNLLSMILAAVLVFSLFPAVPEAATTRKCYTISSGNTPVYSNTGLTVHKGTIYGSDEITVSTVTGTYCRVTYPISRGTKSGYIHTSAILWGTTGNNYTSTGKITTYKRPGGSSYGYVSKGDIVKVLGSNGSYTQIKYPVSYGYKYAFITNLDTNTYLYGGGNSYVDVAAGTYYFQSAVASGKSLDVSGGYSADNTNIQIWDSNGTDAQKFSISKLSSGWYKILNANGKAVDVSGGVSAEGANVVQYTYNGTHAQQWKFISAGNGYYYIQSRLGYYLDVSGGGTANGTNVHTWSRNNTNAQKWKLEQAGASSSSAKIELNVPSYKQYDSRWKNTYIGTKTIGSIGCLLTSLAMKYSYHTGTITYPNAMKSKLKFSNNDLIWSSVSSLGYVYTDNYNTAITNSIKSTIYNKLKANKPVIIGGRRSSGGTHWVVVTGYTGSSSSSFNTADFKINDPNSSTRTNLDQFLSAYPTVLRLIY